MGLDLVALRPGTTNQRIENSTGQRHNNLQLTSKINRQILILLHRSHWDDHFRDKELNKNKKQDKQQIQLTKTLITTKTQNFFVQTINNNVNVESDEIRGKHR